MRICFSRYNHWILRIQKISELYLLIISRDDFPVFLSFSRPFSPSFLWFPCFLYSHFYFFSFIDSYYSILFYSILFTTTQFNSIQFNSLNSIQFNSIQFLLISFNSIQSVLLILLLLILIQFFFLSSYLFYSPRCFFCITVYPL